jgi:hypothetical protein
LSLCVIDDLGEPRCDILAVCLPMLRQRRAQLLDTVHHGRGIGPGFRDHCDCAAKLRTTSSSCSP